MSGDGVSTTQLGGRHHGRPHYGADFDPRPPALGRPQLPQWETEAPSLASEFNDGS